MSVRPWRCGHISPARKKWREQGSASAKPAKIHSWLFHPWKDLFDVADSFAIARGGGWVYRPVSMLPVSATPRACPPDSPAPAAFVRSRATHFHRENRSARRRPRPGTMPRARPTPRTPARKAGRSVEKAGKVMAKRPDAAVAGRPRGRRRKVLSGERWDARWPTRRTPMGGRRRSAEGRALRAPHRLCDHDVADRQAPTFSRMAANNSTRDTTSTGWQDASQRIHASSPRDSKGCQRGT